MQQVVIVGRLGDNPTRFVTPTGDVTTHMSLATDEEAGATEWHTVVARGAEAEYAYWKLKKGSLVRVEGRLRSRDVRGIRVVTIRATRVELCANGNAAGSPAVVPLPHIPPSPSPQPSP